MARTPVYMEIAEWLRGEAARRGRGALMPTINEVYERFDVSGVQTVRNAYELLIEEGLVVRKDSPRRWAVVDNGPAPAPHPEIGHIVAELKELLSRSRDLLNELEHRSI